MNSKLTVLYHDNNFKLDELNQPLAMFSPSSQSRAGLGWVGFWVPAGLRDSRIDRSKRTTRL
jgi:hypothetical protein